MHTPLLQKLKPHLDHALIDLLRITKPEDAEGLATRRIYRVQPATYNIRDFSPDTHTYYVEIARLSDGKKHFSWKSEDWRDTDSWAHPRFRLWEKEEAFWRSEQALRRTPEVKFDECGFVVRSRADTWRARHV